MKHSLIRKQSVIGFNIELFPQRNKPKKFLYYYSLTSCKTIQESKISCWNMPLNLDVCNVKEEDWFLIHTIFNSILQKGSFGLPSGATEKRSSSSGNHEFDSRWCHSHALWVGMMGALAWASVTVTLASLGCVWDYVCRKEQIWLSLGVC